MERWRIGDSVITRVPDENFELVVPQDDATTSVLLSQASWLAPHFLTGAGELRVGTSALAIDTAGAHVVVDPWLAFDDPDRTAPEARARIERLLGNLADAAFPPETVDVVVNTHIDGVGTNTRPEGATEVPAFPNARYLIASEEIAALHAGRFPGAEPLEMLDADGLVDNPDDNPNGRVAGDVSVEPGPGHSPGHHVVRVGPDGGAPSSSATCFFIRRRSSRPSRAADSTRMSRSRPRLAPSCWSGPRKKTRSSSARCGRRPAPGPSFPPTSRVGGGWSRPANDVRSFPWRTRTRRGRRGRTGR